MSSDAAAGVRARTYASWRRQAGWQPRTIVDAEGCYFTDSDGRRYLDLSSQLMCANLGHRNPAVVAAIQRQAETLAFISGAFATEVRAEASARILEVLPAGLTKLFFSTSGAEANEAAFKLARTYTGKQKIIARYNSYHGATAGALSATGDHRRWAGRAADTGNVIFAPDHHCARCPLGLEPSRCGLACLRFIDYVLEHEDDVAAVIVEPVVGTNGILVPPPDYLPRLRELCDRRGVLLIFDEVACGWGRTGAWFACQHWGVTPDILTTAKGVTNASVPLGVTATSAAIAEHFETAILPHGHTYQAHPLGLAAAVAVVDEMRSRRLVERAREVGAYLGSALQRLQERRRIVGDVRGLGLFWAIELVADRQRPTPLNTRRDKASGVSLTIDAINAELFARGLYVLSWTSHFVVSPPLIIEPAEIDHAVGVLDEVLALWD